MKCSMSSKKGKGVVSGTTPRETEIHYFCNVDNFGLLQGEFMLGGIFLDTVQNIITTGDGNFGNLLGQK